LEPHYNFDVSFLTKWYLNCRLFFARQQLVQALQKKESIYRNDGIAMAIDTLTGAAGIMADVDQKLLAIISAELGHYYAKYDTRPIASQKARDNYKKVKNHFRPHYA